jgi:tetratricopeptide (TPR) repeat protein
VRFHLSPWEEVVALLLFFLGLGISRGLYGLVPFLLSLGIGAMTAWVGVLSLRLVQRPAVKLGNVQLKLNGKLTKGGRRFALGALMAGVCLAHGGFIRWHQFQGEALFEQVTHRASQDVEDPSLDQVRAAASHYEAINDRAWIDYPLAEERWAVMRAMEGALEAQAGRAQMALGAYSAALGAHPDPGGVHLSMGELLAGMDQFPRAIDHLRAAVHYHPTSAAAHYNLAVLVAHGGDTEEGIAHLTKAAKLDPDDAEIQNNLGFLLAGEGHVRQAEEHLQRAIELDSSFAIPYLNLGLLVWAQGRSDEARELLRRGLELAPGAVPMLEKAGYPLENLR